MKTTSYFDTRPWNPTRATPFQEGWFIERERQSEPLS